MKHYKKIQNTAALFTLSLASAGFATSGDRIGNGGAGITQQGALILKDLSQQSCTWRSGSRLTGELPYYDRILTTLASIDPIYRKIMATVAEGVNFCLSDNRLIQLGYEDPDGVTVFRDNATQIAIRVGTEVYVDQDQFEKMDARNQAFLVFHELMHPFIANSTSRRHAKLRGFTKFVLDLEGQIAGASALDMTFWREETARQIVFNAVDWPATRQEKAVAQDFLGYRERLLRAIDLRQADNGAYLGFRAHANAYFALPADQYLVPTEAGNSRAMHLACALLPLANSCFSQFWNLISGYFTAIGQSSPASGIFASSLDATSYSPFGDLPRGEWPLKVEFVPSQGKDMNDCRKESGSGNRLILDPNSLALTLRIASNVENLIAILDAVDKGDVQIPAFTAHRVQLDLAYVEKKHWWQKSPLSEADKEGLMPIFNVARHYNEYNWIVNNNGLFSYVAASSYPTKCEINREGWVTEETDKNYLALPLTQAQYELLSTKFRMN